MAAHLAFSRSGRYGDDGLLGVQVIVCQAAQLAAAQPAQQREPPQEGQPVVRGVREEVRDLRRLPDERRVPRLASSSTAYTGLNGIL